MPHLPTVRQTGITRILLSGLVLLELLSVNVQTVHAAPSPTTTTPVITITSTTTVETTDIEMDDTSTTTIKDITVTTTRPATLKTYSIDTTAYGSNKWETDDSPFITADGSTVRDGIIAANFLPFGTKVRFPALFGDKVFEVHDRMNARYNLRADFWMSNDKAVRQFGIKHNVKIEVIEWGTGKKQWKTAAK